MRTDHKFKIGQKVFLEGDDRAWYVTGVSAKIGYDLFLWQYQITRAVYGDYPPTCLGARCDSDSKLAVCEDHLRDVAAHMIELDARLQKEIEQKRIELAKLEAELKGAKE